jgi:hypothetical protein
MAAFAAAAIRHRYVDTPADDEASGVVPGAGSTFRRPPSLRRVVVEGHCPGFIGTIRTLRLPAARPAALRCLRLAVPPLRRLFAPAGGRRAALGPGCLFTRPSIRRDRSVEEAGSPKFPHRPSCRPAHAPSTPDRPHGTCLDAPMRRGHGYGNSRGSVDGLFGAQSHGWAARCPRFKAPGCPDAMQDSLPAARLRSAGWASHPLGLP